MKYTISFENNKIFFTNRYAKGIITIENNQAEISLVKVDRDFRGLGYGKSLMKTLLNFIQERLNNIKKVFLSPLPLDRSGLTKQELVSFYSKFNFQPSSTPPRYAPYMMEKYF